jgi:hypothetical protein
VKNLKDLIIGSSVEPYARYTYNFFTKDKFETPSSRLGTKKFLLACFPKSGSTYVSNVISQHDNFEKVKLVPSHERREQELDIRFLHRYRKISYVAQQHVRASKETEKLIQQFNLIPIVLVRNIFDITVSIADHLRAESFAAPMARFTEDHLALTDEQLHIAIAHLAIPWYINFYVGWKLSPFNKNIFTYERMTLNHIDFFKEIFLLAGNTVREETLSELIGNAMKGKTRLNVGRVGRGDKVPGEAKAHIERLCSYYPNIDFSEIGVLKKG